MPYFFYWFEINFHISPVFLKYQNNLLLVYELWVINQK